MGIASAVENALGGEDYVPPKSMSFASTVERAVNDDLPDDGQVPGTPPQPKPKDEPGWWEKYIGKGSGEAATSIATGAIAAPIGAVAGIVKNLTSGKFGTAEGIKIAQDRAREVQDSLTYQPHTEAGKAALEDISEALDASKLQGLGPTEGITLGGVMAGPAKIAKAIPVETSTPKAMGSVGAAGTEPTAVARASVANASPELQQIVEQHIKNEAPINQAVLDRHAQADSLPIPIQLTKGQATQDVGILSQEQNMRGTKESLRNRFSDQNNQLIANTNAIKENAAPDVYATTAPEHGDILIDAYKAKDAKLNADISAKYKALSDANGGDFPLDGAKFADSADVALHKALKSEFVPAPIEKQLQNIKNNGMNFEQFEAMRTNLANIQRSNVDGNVKAAAGIIRNALEDLPMPPGAEGLKPLADQARAAAKARFSLIEKDPAYKAVVSGKASADRFIEKLVVGADTKDVKTMKQNLSDDPTASQAIASGVVNHLKQRAGILDDQGNFSQAGYNKALENLRPKLDTIFEAEPKAQIENLGKVARYTQAQPRGSFVNNSNTAVSLMSEGAKHALEGAANVMTPGIQGGTMVRRALSNRQQNLLMRQSLEPGAGILLKDIR